MTTMAREVLNRYLVGVRRSLEHRRDVDVGDVEAGIVEHVETVLAMRSIEHATAEDVSDVLEQLGPAAALGESGDPGDAWEEGAAGEMSRTGALSALALMGSGLALFALNVPVVGLIAVGAGVLLARVLISSADTIRSPESRMVVLVWQLAVIGGLAVLLLGPAALAWGAAQIGGILEGPLTGYLGVSGAGRPLRYWVATGLVAGAVTGAWWLLVGALATRHADALTRALGPAAHFIPARSGRVVFTIGAILLIGCSITGWLL